MSIKFYQYYATNGTTKVKIHYSLDGRTDKRNCVTIYARDYNRADFKAIFGDIARNDSDMMTDYFEQSHADIFESHPLYNLARQKAEHYLTKIKQRRNRGY